MGQGSLVLEVVACLWLLRSLLFVLCLQICHNDNQVLRVGPRSTLLLVRSK